MSNSQTAQLDRACLRAGSAELGLALMDEAVVGLEEYGMLLRVWNQRMNLVSKASLAHFETRHVLDSLTLVAAVDAPISGPVIDVGSGAGLPGLPLKIVFPEIDLTLVEATAKKARFLEKAIEQLRLDSARAVAERAEILARDPEYRERFQVVLARAIAPLPALVELTLPFCRQSGVVVAYKSRGVEGEVEEAGAAIKMLGGAPPRLIEVPASVTGDPRVLVVIEKQEHTPEKYPRRPGMPTKQPLGV